MRGLLHVHSSWSHDGECTTAELARWGERRGLDLILLTEHFNAFDRERMARYVDEVDSLPRGRCRLVPGLEFAVRGGFHVLAYGLRSWVDGVEPLETVRGIRAGGGLAVLAHPARYRGQWPADEVLRELHGVEVWNARYDGRFVPSGEIVESARAACARFPQLMWFGGQDLHRASSHRLVVTAADGAGGADDFLAALRAGAATFGAPGFRFDSRPGGRRPAPALLRHGHRIYRWARRARDAWAG